jgi:prepilin-type N-terminal cleavage/methylation domain-containing protein
VRRSAQGMTLIEVMVALVFTGIAFTALALSQVTGFRVTRSSQETTIAKDLAMRQMELFRSYGFEPFKRCPTFDPELDGWVGYPECEDDLLSTEHPGFGVEWEITNNPAGTKVMSPPALIEVNVTVTWNSRVGGAKEFYLTSYLSCGDPGEGATTNVPCPKTSLRAP